jgi:hypothetical protein
MFLVQSSKFEVILRRGGEIGIHARLKILWPQGRAGSTPALGTHNQFERVNEVIAREIPRLVAISVGNSRGIANSPARIG